MTEKTQIVKLSGHLTRTALTQSLEAISFSAGGAIDLVIDASAMTDYDADARAFFVEWNKAHADRVSRVAVVTTKPLWHMVVRAMSLASRKEMRPFSSVEAAVAWLEST